MCRESPDSYLNRVSQLNENPNMRYLHAARSALTSLRHLNLKHLSKIEPFLIKSELDLLLEIQNSVLDLISLIEKRVCLEEI